MRNTLIALLLMCSGFAAHADSYMYFTNNSLKTVSLQTTQSGYTNLVEGVHWQQLARTVPPLATVKFLRFNRDEGIKWGKTYYFDTRVSGDGSSMLLRQKLIGTWNFSEMYFSAEDQAWIYDHDYHYLHGAWQQKAATLGMRSQYARTSGDDIYYVLHPQNQAHSVSDNDNEFSVLTYNTWTLLPGILSFNAGNRLDSIVDAVKGYDAVAFQEVFDPYLTARFREQIQKEYPYLTEIPWKLGKILTGGTFIASRWPIVQQDTAVYDACISDGCLAAKGINYAQIKKGTRIYNLFNTHTHAYTTADDIAVRMQHLQQLRGFVESKNIPADQALIMAGDFNVDKIHFPQEYADFLSLLNAGEPLYTPDYPHSYAGPVNHWAEDQYTEYLDYVLAEASHLQPLSYRNSLHVPRSIAPEHWTTWDLSDHFPVAGDFVFP